ncbi:aldehyde dehydrogenase [Salinivirga cyanobacteriivorans]
MQDISALLKRQSAFFYEEADLNVDFRIKALNKLAEVIKKYEDPIHAALKADLGKSSYESFITETGFVQHEISFVKRHLKQWAKPQKVKKSLKLLFATKSYIHYEARGQVLIYAPWNYPFQLFMSPLIGAIAAGNTVVLKPSEHAPTVSSVLEQMISEIFPEKYIAVVQGDATVAQELSKLDWDMIFFTGSTAIGQKIYEQAAQKLIPVVLELGGKCPVLVHKDANLKVAARRIAWGKILNAGQTCIAPDHIVVHKSVKDRLLKLLCKEFKSMLGKNPAESAAYARIVNKAHFERLVNMLDQAEIFCGGNYNAEERYIEPTIVDNVQPAHTLMKEEIFGPILPVQSYENINDAILYINRLHPPLAIYAFTGAKSTFEQIQRHTQSGAMVKNDVIMQLTNMYLPFGGVRQSGIGRYHGRFSFEAFSYQRSFLHQTTWTDPAMRYPPYSEKKWKLIKKVLK